MGQRQKWSASGPLRLAFELVSCEQLDVLLTQVDDIVLPPVISQKGRPQTQCLTEGGKRIISDVLGVTVAAGHVSGNDNSL